ncbi:MAG: hypothetical protein HY749_01140 [Gammaproteobacteria bacterium]|nr:hypothetical protein [Gammaproteobacteria bacterium]MBI5615483.1 hypothetical protein [Gammaproteobacteria bacterium]
MTKRTAARAAPLQHDKVPFGKPTLGAAAAPRSRLEDDVLKPLDPDRLNDLGECLFTLNNRRYGPIPGAYVVVCIEEGRRWCVGQLCADRTKPLVLFEAEVYTSPTVAQARAEEIRASRNEALPGRNT